MELQQLRYFLCASKTASFALVAERFGVSRQAISSSIKSLESELKITLFDRSHNRLTLTPEAKEFMVRAKETVDLFDQIEARCEAPVVRSLSLALDSFLFEPSSRILESLLEYSNTPNGCVIQLHQESFTRIMHSIDKRTCDIGIVRTMDPVIRDRECITLRKATLGCIVGEGHRLASWGTVCLSDLFGEPLILPNGYEMRYRPLSANGFLDFSNCSTTIIDEKTMATDAVRRGFGIGVTDFCSEVKSSSHNGIVRLPFGDPAYQIYDVLFYRKDSSKSDLIKDFANWVVGNDCWRTWDLSHSADS